MAENESLSFLNLVRRALACRCPACGKGKLFARYLKQVEQCSVCGENLGHIRADDGPPWLTIVIVGHLLAPLMLLVVPNSNWPNWVDMTLWPALALIMMVVVLPFSKALFIGLIRRTQCAGAKE